MGRRKHGTVFAAAASLSVACSGGSQTPGDARVAQTTQALATATGLPQYIHSLQCSRMSLGPNPTSVSFGPFTKVRGDWGTYVLDPANGHVYGVERKGSPLLTMAPYGSSVQAHGQAVQQYFQSCGLPADEIGGVLPRVGGRMLGAVGTAPQSVGQQMYYSVVTRAVDGIAIPDSFAWARMAENGGVVREDVYWPAIPQSAVDGGLALQQQLSTSAGAASFRAGLPAGDGRVVIRHSSPWAPPNVAFEAYAVYDITTSDGKGSSQTHHFDAQKNEVRLPQERWPVPAQPAKP